MCGINGFNFNDTLLIKKMNSSLIHRGPDGNSFYNNELLTLGHARLSIIDLSTLASQPMSYFYENNNYIIVFNGEIYNYIEIKNELLKTQKYLFNTSSDTEVVLAAYLEWGNKCVDKFNGMWAFAIYDSSKNKLFLSRDRLGVKPLYYYSKNGKFIFSSEIKGILCHKELNINSYNSISKDSVDLYFSLGYIPAPLTIYKDVNKLEAGTNMDVSLVDGKIINIYKYYSIPIHETHENKKQLIEEGKFLLNDSVKLRMRSDVPVGAFLSGGLDSTSVVGEMANFTSLRNLHTFSIGFDDSKFDESDYIKLASNYFDTNHHHYQFTKNDFSENLIKFSEYFDEPFADYSALAGFKVSQIAREHTTVVLSGDGGDEIFGGYPIYNAGFIYDKIALIPKSIRKKIIAGLNYLPESSHSLNKIKQLFDLTLNDKSSFYTNLYKTQRFKPEIYKHWTSEHMKISLEYANNSMSEGLRIFDLLYNTLSNNYLVKVDRTSMANSIEVRSPFLDFRFLKFSQKIPIHYKVGYKGSKILMREIIRDLIPLEILNRKKMGFTPPIHKWLYDQLNDKSFYKYLSYLETFNKDLISYYEKVYYQKDFNNIKEYELIKLVIFANWYEHWININD